MKRILRRLVTGVAAASLLLWTAGVAVGRFGRSVDADPGPTAGRELPHGR